MKHLEETIKLLDHIKENPQATQRELVDKLDVSLGKVNFLIQSLADQGLIKLKRFKNSHRKRAYMYLITPEGIIEKTRITKDFLMGKMNEYDKLRMEIDKLKKKVENSEEYNSGI